MPEKEDPSLEEIRDEAKKILGDLDQEKSVLDDGRKTSPIEPGIDAPSLMSPNRSVGSQPQDKTPDTSGIRRVIPLAGFGLMITLGSVSATIYLQNVLNHPSLNPSKSVPGFADTTAGRKGKAQLKEPKKRPVKISRPEPSPVPTPGPAPQPKQKFRRIDTPDPQKGKDQPSVSVPGVDLAITNRLCNRRGNFCIYDLARLITTERGYASYSFYEFVNGERVEVNGTIEIERPAQSNPVQMARFSFRDNQATTTPGWAALGVFYLGQKTSRPGISTTFRATQSFGSKSPVGVENKSFVFPN